MVGVSLDTTQRRNGEETLRNFAIELERQVDERTAEREAVSAQLHEAQKIETLGQLTGGVAHDFNNLLTPIVGGLEIVLRKTTDDRSKRLLSGALQSAERARILVSRLLAFARRQALEARPVDVANLLNGLADLIQRSIGPTIALTIAIDDDVSPTMVDPNQLELALLNLAVNARDAMADGGALSIFADEPNPATRPSALASGRYVRIRVSDTGTGMDAVTLSRAVEPFYSTKGIGKGTGLGLSMVHGLAGQSGGALSLISAPGQGTTAELWLPVTARDAVEGRDAPRELFNANSLRILLVDDEEPARRVTIEMLSELGHDVVDADSGAAGLELVRSRPFDVIVTDYLMPGMTGIEFIREARKVSANLPALMITGYADLAAGKGHDIDRLAKPFGLADLANALHEFSPA